MPAIATIYGRFTACRYYTWEKTLPPIVSESIMGREQGRLTAFCRDSAIFPPQFMSPACDAYER